MTQIFRILFFCSLNYKIDFYEYLCLTNDIIFQISQDQNSNIKIKFKQIGKKRSIKTLKLQKFVLLSGFQHLSILCAAKLEPNYKNFKQGDKVLQLFIFLDFSSFNIIKNILIIKKNSWRKMHGQDKEEKFNKNSKFIKKFKHQSSQSDQFQLQYHQIKKLGLPVNKKKLRVGNWTPQENFTYLKFLQDNRNDFVTEQQRRKNKVFFRLSKILKKRTPDQCRSHHQKLQMKYQDNIQEIIINIKRKLNKKSPQILDAQAKQKSTYNKKTQVVDKIEEDDQSQIIIQQTNLYKIQKKGQNTIQILLFADNLKFWV